MDLFETIRTTRNVDVAAHVASSIAWRIDVMLAQNLRQAAKDIREVALTIDGFNELNASIAEKICDEAFIRDSGGEEGYVANVFALNTARQVWHNLAKELAGMTYDKDGNVKSYNIPTVEDVLTAKVELKVKPESIARTIKRTERMAAAYDLSPEERQHSVDKNVARKHAKAQETSKFLTDQGPILLLVFNTLMSRCDETISEHFADLPKAIQQVLVQSAKESATRFASWAEDYWWLSEPEFDDIDMCVLSLTKKLGTTRATITMSTKPQPSTPVPTVTKSKIPSAKFELHELESDELLD